MATAENFSAISVGKLSELGDYVLELSPEVKIPGKVFGGAALQATGSEFSFQMFQPGTETGFLHTHRIMRNFIFSFREKASSKWTDKCSLLKKAAWYGVSPPTESAACATTGQLRDALCAVSGRHVHGRRRHSWRDFE